MKGIKRQAPLSYDDDYDPTRPNDYEEFKEYEKKRRENEAVNRQEGLRPRSMSIDSEKQHSPPRELFFYFILFLDPL